MDRQVNRARKDFEDFSKVEDVLEYVFDIRELFISVFFLYEGLFSLTQITSNPVEQFFKWIKELRDLPIITFFQELDKMICEKIQQVPCVCLSFSFF